MREWPPQHRTLAAVVLFLAVMAGLFCFLVLRPKWQSVKDSREQVLTKQAELKKHGWPLDPERLRALLEAKQKYERRTATLSEDVVQQATSMFDRKIRMFFGTPEDFRVEVSLLDYQEEFDQITRRFRQQDVVLEESILGIGETSSSAYTYQLVLHLWTMESLLDLVLKHNLRPTTDASVTVQTDRGRKQAAMVTCLPMESYILDPGDKTPYIIEFPLRLTVRGKLEDFCALLRALHADGNYFPISNVELRKVVPPANLPALDVVEISMVCSSFFRTEHELPKETAPAVRKLPPGA